MKKKSLRAAVNAHCKSCCYDSKWKGGGSWLKQVTNCQGYSCELYSVRPTCKSENNEGEAPILDITDE